ncbi:glycoside hydrolase family protein [Advenella mimigardefordensis]|uniref:Lysozyme n=1 Tax=Advenella mimigardefordensis (strain DSM 17166 / LMG 22922 / DPN7) TaxID=1247726 RepID=W0PKD2_ADVMD|nr:hypothetical protein [Advenella mimigardefordensis]AHG65458.1 lysozyme-like domain-containing protein [Advenella mimigardefordensis DPN7]
MADATTTPGNIPASIQPDLLRWGNLTGPNYSSPAMRLAANATEAGSFTVANTAQTVADGQATLTTATAAPCATCKKDGAYSIAFEIKDADGNLCKKRKDDTKGMNYTVKYKVSGEVYRGSTDENGLTERYFTADKTETLYFYLGHRTDDDGYPTAQTETANQTDEAPLTAKAYAVAPIADKKIEKLTTVRKWKPWKASDNYTSLIEGAEGREAKQYPSVEGGNDTIGIGHKITDAEIASKRFTQGDWAQPLSDAKMNELLQEDIKKNGGNRIEREVFVPLYAYEVDAILDLGFNGGPGALTANAASIYSHDGTKNPKNTNRQNLGELLNRGRYSMVPAYLESHYNTSNSVWVAGVQNRRDMDVRMFSGDQTNGYTLMQNHTTRHPAHNDNP